MVDRARAATVAEVAASLHQISPGMSPADATTMVLRAAGALEVIDKAEALLAIGDGEGPLHTQLRLDAAIALGLALDYYHEHSS